MSKLRERTGFTSPLHDQTIGDATYHLVIDSYRVQQTTGDREIEEIVTTIGYALGLLLVAATDRAIGQGRDEGVARFFKALVDRMGPGVYEMEIGPHGEPVGQPVVH